MSSLMLRHVVHDGRVTDVRIEDGRFAAIGPQPSDATADQVIDARGPKAITPPFYNGHTHAAMTLLRGFAEDLELATWLTEHIWPAEATLTADDIYAGSRLAILEMINSGTVFFNDMYWEQSATVRAAVEMGVRAQVGLLHISGPDGQPNPRSAASNAEVLALEPDLPGRITIAHAPHSPYAVDRSHWRGSGRTRPAPGGGSTPTPQRPPRRCGTVWPPTAPRQWPTWINSVW